MEKDSINWEKIGVYLAIVTAFITVIVYLFGFKDDMAVMRERMAVVETKLILIRTPTMDAEQSMEYECLKYEIDVMKSWMVRKGVLPIEVAIELED